MGGVKANARWWAPYLLLATAAIAGAVWYALPQAGVWPFAAWTVLWLLCGLLTGRWWTETPYDIPLALFLLTAYAGVLVAFNREVAWTKYWTIVGGVMLFYAIAHLPTPSHRRGFAWVYALFGAGVAGYFLWTHDWDAIPAKVEVFTTWGRALQAWLPVLPGHRLHPNVVGGMLAAILPFQVWAVASPGRRPWLRRLVAGPALALGAGALVMTTSRGAWLAVGIAGGAGCLWAASRSLPVRQASPAAARWSALLRRLARSLVLLILAAVVAAGAALVLTDPLILAHRLDGVLDVGSRPALLKHAVWLVQDYGFTGGGLGGFQLLHATYVLVLHVGHSIHSHNLFLDIGVEQGVFGLLAFLACIAVAGVQIRRSGQEHGLASTAAASLGAVLLHGLVEDALYGSRGVLLLFIPLGLLLAPQPSCKARTIRWRWAMAPGGVILAALALLLWGRPLVAAGWANAGTVAQARAELSIYRFPGATPREVRTHVDLGSAVADFQRALALNPRNRTANLRLGMIRYEEGRYVEARDLLQRAYAVEPAHPATRELLAYALVALGQPEDAARLLSQEALGPSGVQKMVWEAESYRKRGALAQAADGYRAVLLVEPDNEAARQGLARVAP